MLTKQLRPYTFVLLVVLLTLGIAACSKSSSGSAETQPVSTPESTPSAAAATTSPCSYLKVEDAEAVMGKGAQVNPGRIDYECNVDPADASHGGLIVSILPAHHWEGTKATLTANNKDTKEVKGVGDDAYYLMTGLIVKKGDKQVSISGLLFNTQMTTEEAELYLAKKIVERM